MGHTKVNREKRRPVIQDKAVVADRTKGRVPIGEAFRPGDPIPTQPMTPAERQNMVERLERSISALMDEAEKTYQKNCYKPGTTEVDPDYITRLSTNEFFFYTKEPLTLKEFEELQNKIADKAKTLSPGVQLVLGSFAVKTDNNQVMSVTPHITCGQEPDFNFIVKNETSKIDVRYKIPDGKDNTDVLEVLDIKNRPRIMPKITVNGSERHFTFNNIVFCKTPDGTPFLTAVEVCVDHAYGFAKGNATALEEERPDIAFSQPISHVIISNSIDLIEEHSVGFNAMHVDPYYSKKKCKEGVPQVVDSKHSPIFGNDHFTIYDVDAIQYSLIQNTYAHKTSQPSEGRNHLFAASTQHFKNQYQALRGDHLKTKILEDFRSQIEETTTPKELAKLKQILLTSAEYKVLKTGQGLFTRITGIKTSSVKALEEMFKAQEERLGQLTGANTKSLY